MSVLPGNGNGAFQGAVKFKAGSLPLSIPGRWRGKASRVAGFASAMAFFSILAAGMFVAPVAGQVPSSSHVFLVVLENYSYSTVTNSADSTNYMPWLISQGNAYGHATAYTTNSSGSLLAYLWLSSGSCHGDQLIYPNNDCTLPPGTHSFGCTGGSCLYPITDDNIYREMISRGISWKLYAESIPYVGFMGDSGSDPGTPYYPYDDHHNAPKWYSDIIDSPAQQQNMVPFTQFTADFAAHQFPYYSFVIPNNLHNAHNGTPAEADAWLQSNIGPLLNEHYFQTCGDGLLIITWDNADLDATGLVYTAVIGPRVIPHSVSNTPYMHENTLRTILDALGITTRPGASATVSGMTDFFYTPGNCATILVDTPPSGRQITVDGATYTAPQTFNWVVGSSHSIGVSSPQSGATGTQYVFSAWSDGGSQTHNITVPSTTTTYTASFATQYLLTTAVSPGGGGSVNPDCSSGCWYNSGAGVSLQATATTGYSFSNWSGSVAGSANPLSLTMSGPLSETANFNPPLGPFRVSHSPEFWCASRRRNERRADDIRQQRQQHFRRPGHRRFRRFRPDQHLWRFAWGQQQLHGYGDLQANLGWASQRVAQHIRYHPERHPPSSAIRNRDFRRRGGKRASLER